VGRDNGFYTLTLLYFSFVMYSIRVKFKWFLAKYKQNKYNCELSVAVSSYTDHNEKHFRKIFKRRGSQFHRFMWKKWDCSFRLQNNPIYKMSEIDIARGSVVGWGPVLQAGKSRVQVPMRWNFSSFQPHYGPGVDAASIRNEILWDPQRLTTLWAFTACYRDSFTFFFYQSPQRSRY
jgi:hypothetical protein